MKFVTPRMRTVGAATAALALTTIVALAAGEKAPTASAAAILGADVKGDNYTVAETVKTDGFVRIFSVSSKYGDFQVNGENRMRQRVQELKALHALEGMSQSDEFLKAVANAGIAPIRFVGNLVVDPIETTGSVITGIGKMFANVEAGVSGKGGGRDDTLSSLTGQTAAERELAFRLGVDPYTDFTPLRNGLHEVSRVMSAGNITVSAATMAIPGGAGMAVGAAQTSADFANSVASKTAADIAEIVRTQLTALGVSNTTIDAFIKNQAYTPQDLFAIAESLTELKAANTEAFVARAAAAESADVAKFMVYRADLLAQDSGKLGGLKEFVLVGDIVVNRDGAGRIVVAAPFDLVAWTDTVETSVTRLTADVTAADAKAPRVFATTGPVGPRAAAELKKLGWTVVRL